MVGFHVLQGVEEVSMKLRPRDWPSPSAVVCGATLLGPYIPIYRMVKTIRVSEEYHEWLNAHKRTDETMEETLRRMTRGPHPNDVAGLLTEEGAEDAKEAVDRLRGRDRDRLDAARNAFESGDSVE